MQPPQIPPHGALSFETRLRTRWSDEDNQAVLNNAVYLTLLEEARHAYFRRLGLLDENRFPFVLAQSNVRFVAPGRGGVEVTVAMATTHLGRSSFVQAYRVLGPATGPDVHGEAAGSAVWCEAEALLVAWDPETRGARPMEADFRAALAAAEPGLASAGDGA